jgi:hypothetical protein
MIKNSRGSVKSVLFDEGITEEKDYQSKLGRFNRAKAIWEKDKDKFNLF